ncbi:MAG: oxidoreductase [Pirellulales bacterium]|nr:oxidoreductase [Pirellulales bacterium]
MNHETLYTAIGYVVVLCPAALFALLGGTAMAGRPLTERITSRSTELAVVTGLLASTLMLVLMLWWDTRYVPVDLGNLVVIPEQHFHFHLKFVFDRLSVPFLILSYALVGTVGAFANRYLHREQGYHRFFLFYAMFLLGMVVASLAGTIETLFLGWELVGLSSALLVAYFHERPSPVLNGQRIWSVYRVADAAFLIAAVAMHHVTGEGDFSALMGMGAWPEGQAALNSNQALVIGLLLLIAAAGKSGLIPFSGWLPRAMEGPTPSSAVFYGALSVHLGALLLLRAAPLLDQSYLLSAAVVVLGLASALFGTLIGRVQSDVKSALAFASLTQVGIITAEIGFGFRYIALIHIIGHACLRTLQLLRAPNLLRDYRSIENAIGAHLPQSQLSWTGRLSPALRLRLYRLSFERGYFDALLDAYIVRPFVHVFRWCDAAERRWTDLLSGAQSRESDLVPATAAWEEESK